jgi:hypothetical protein
MRRRSEQMQYQRSFLVCFSSPLYEPQAEVQNVLPTFCKAALVLHLL